MKCLEREESLPGVSESGGKQGIRDSRGRGSVRKGGNQESPMAGQLKLEMPITRAPEEVPLVLHSVPGLFPLFILSVPVPTQGSGSPAVCSVSPHVCLGVGSERFF